MESSRTDTLAHARLIVLTHLAHEMQHKGAISARSDRPPTVEREFSRAVLGLLLFGVVASIAVIVWFTYAQ